MITLTNNTANVKNAVINEFMAIDLDIEMICYTGTTVENKQAVDNGLVVYSYFDECMASDMFMIVEVKITQDGFVKIGEQVDEGGFESMSDVSFFLSQKEVITLN